jgi:tripartite-type tricarboxylate transporter receptor subunit TctC
MRVTAALLCVLFLPAGAWAADVYPQRAVRLIIPYPPGGAGDIIGRMLGAKLTEALQQQIVIDNRGGGGQVQVMCTSPLPALPHVKSGRLRGLAMTGRTRSRAAPEIPTVAESGVPGYESSLWYALLAPAGTPQPIISRVHAETVRILRSSEVTEQLLGQGAEPIGNSPRELLKFLAAEIDRWTRLIEQAKIRAE